MNNKGVLLIVSGPSGAGKGTICQALIEKYPEDYALSISVTSRLPRGEEVEGKEYFFRTRSEFEEMIELDLLLEYACYVDNYYGTPREWVELKRREGINVILEIDCQGGFQVSEKIPEAVRIFIMPPSMEELERRLLNRGTETPEQIALRIERAREEVRFAQQYDYIIVNEVVEKSVEMLHNIVCAEKEKV